MLLVALFLTSAFISFLLTPACRNIALWLGLLDHPDADRKLHNRPIPRVGGIAILLACAFSLAVMVLLPSSTDFTKYVPRVVPLLPSIVIIASIGLLDDLFGLRPWQKLLGETLAAVLTCCAGVHVAGFAGYQFPSWAAVPVTIIWL